MTELLVGCPVRKREWILPLWKQHVLTAAQDAGVDVEFIFVVGQDDVDSVSWEDATVIPVEEPEREDERHWGTDRFQHMTDLRNKLLVAVREREPRKFLSLDSDILLHPQAITGMLETFQTHPDAWAVGGKAYMSGGRDFPSYGLWVSKADPRLGIRRKNAESVMQVDVLMAVKMMAEPAYQVGYTFHQWGEDMGWSINVGRAGGNMYWDGRYCNKHVMRREQLEKVDARCGY